MYFVWEFPENIDINIIGPAKYDPFFLSPRNKKIAAQIFGNPLYGGGRLHGGNYGHSGPDTPSFSLVIGFRLSVPSKSWFPINVYQTVVL